MIRLSFLTICYPFIKTAWLTHLATAANCEPWSITWMLSELFNSLAPGRSGCDFKNAISNLVLLIRIFRSPHDDIFRWMQRDLTDDKSTLVQGTAWCRQAKLTETKWPSFCTLRFQFNFLIGDLIAISLNFVVKGSNYSKPALVRIWAWHRII